MHSSEADPGLRLPAAVEAAAVVLGCLLVAAVVLALRDVWQVQDPLAGTDLRRYGIVGDDGMATRAVVQTTDGEQHVGTNTRHLTVSQMSAEWPIEARLGLSSLNEDARAGAADYSALEITTTTISAGKDPTRRVAFAAVGPGGLYLLATTLDANATVHELDPPLLVRPAAMEVGDTWETQGSFGVIGAYRFRGKVAPAQRVEGPLGVFDDCLVVTEQLAFGPGADQLQGNHEVTYSCPDVGEVARRTQATSSRTDLVATTRLPGVAAEELEASLSPGNLDPHGPAGDPSVWALSAVGSVAGGRSSSAPSFAPALLTGPRLAAARVGGHLVATDAGRDVAGPSWQFYAGNNVGGALDIADDGSRVVLGATNGTVYSLTAEGVLEWSARADDAITAVAIDDAGGAVYASEDNTVVAVDAAGAHRWRVTTGGPVTSRPGLSGGRVVVAGEDGTITIIGAASGVVEHQVDVGEPVTADVTIAGAVAVVPTWEGQLIALDLDSGDIRWRAATGGDIHAAAAADGDRVLAVVEGRLQTYDLGDGRAGARSESRGYVGAARPTDSGVLLSRADGGIDLLAPDGRVLTSWEQPALPGAFKEGLVAGAGAAWGINAQGVLYRLGEPRDGDAAPLVASWSLDLAEPALLASGSVPAYPAIAAPDAAAVLLDFGGGVQRLDTSTGRAEHLGSIDGVEDPAGGGVITDDVLLVGSRNSLHAVTYPDLTPLWRHRGLGGSAGRPVVAGTTVYWSIAEPGDRGGVSRARLRALDLRTGAVRWETAAATAIVATGVTVIGDLVVAAHVPAAYDVATGEQVWSLADRGPGLGGPAVSPDGRSLAIGTLNLQAGSADAVLIVDAATGAVRHELPLPRGSVIDASDAIRWDHSGLVVPQLDGGIAAFAADGTQRWSYQSAVGRFGDLGHTPEDVWLELADGRVVTLDRETGDVTGRDVRASARLDVTSATARPTFIGDTMIIADGDSVRAYDASGGGPP